MIKLIIQNKIAEHKHLSSAIFVSKYDSVGIGQSLWSHTYI